ncbi:MAG: hypothetical protein MUF34_09575 [Polyangiaceae bacterium]|jgi:hypothetical protein|nr:hypothetical protein [Polyangiaceae bacterium]
MKRTLGAFGLFASSLLLCHCATEVEREPPEGPVTADGPAGAGHLGPDVDLSPAWEPGRPPCASCGSGAYCTGSKTRAYKVVNDDEISCTTVWQETCPNRCVRAPCGQMDYCI